MKGEKIKVRNERNKWGW